MSDPTGVAHPRQWLLGAAMLLVLSGCGGVVLDRSGDSGTSGGATSSGGATASSGAPSTARGGSAPSGGKAGSVAAGGRPGTGGRVGSGGVVGAGGVVGSGGSTFGCAPGFTNCADGCADLQSDPSHCGSCFSTCPSGAKCVNASCQGTTTACHAGTVFCTNFGECLDTSSNPFACGSCSTPCNGTHCTNGVCDPKSCLSKTATYCPSIGGCTELSNDYQNCGACGNACGPADSCVNGKCVPPDCPGSTYCMSSGCTDTNSDANNCGACDKPCLAGSHFDDSEYVCDNGTCGCSFNANRCGKACSASFWYCPPDGFKGQPADLCEQSARNSYESCACKGCLAEIQACFGSPTCINSMDCSLPGACPTCQPVFSTCTDQKGNSDPLAEKLVACMNAQCSKP